jgi:hypothetical protein
VDPSHHVCWWIAQSSKSFISFFCSSAQSSQIFFLHPKTTTLDRPGSEPPAKMDWMLVIKNYDLQSLARVVVPTGKER